MKTANSSRHPDASVPGRRGRSVRRDVVPADPPVDRAEYGVESGSHHSRPAVDRDVAGTGCAEWLTLPIPETLPQAQAGQLGHEIQLTRPGVPQLDREPTDHGRFDDDLLRAD